MAGKLADYSNEELRALTTELENRYAQRRGSNLKLDLTRGKPAADQLSLSDALDGILGGDYRASDGTDVRNYGGLRGLPEARELGGELMGVPADSVIVGSNSSLQLMYIVLELGLQDGLAGPAWSSVERPTVICPVPGYDRHFTVCNELGLEMVTVPMLDNGPDMDAVGAFARDRNVVAIWNVPKYSNPTGYTYSDAVVEALARLPSTAAFTGFTVLWDNAYAVHDFDAEGGDTLASLHTAADSEGTSDRCVQFASTSKITFAGAGISFISSGPGTLAAIEARLSAMTVGPDKVNQLRHARFLGGRLREHMAAHGELVKPKFEAVESALRQDLGELGIASWTTPRGGYFVSLDVAPGLAREIVALAADAGVTLTPAGATFPNGDDPEDRNIRIAPTFASLTDVETSLDVLTLCVRLASARALLEQRA